MELIYSMRRKPLKCEPPHFETSSDPEVVRPICTISACNIIAFSSPTELSDSDGCTWGGHVYVCDLDTPWDSHKVTSTVHPVSALEWDSEGKQLLVATTEGEVSVFGMKEFLLNDWGCLYNASFPGEHVIKAAFFHNGRRVSCDKKPDVPAAERLQLLRPTPTLKGFGGIACEGACIITATGLIGALTPSGEPGKALSGAECLRPARDKVPAASVAHKNGTLIVAAGGVNCVRCAVCSVTLSRAPHQAPSLIVQPLPAVYLDYTPVSLTWSLREDTDSLLIAGSTLSVWNLTQRAHPVHKLLSKGPLQGSTTPGGGQKPGSDCFNTVVWQQISVLPVEGGAHVCSRRLHAAAPHHVLAAHRPNRLLLHRDTHRGGAHVCSRRLHAAAPHHVLAAHRPNRLLLHRDTHRGGAHVCSRRLHAAAPHHVLAAHRPNRLLLHRDTHRGGAHVCSRRLHAAAPHHVLAAHRPNRLLLHRDTHRGGAHVCSRRLHAAAPHHVLAAHRPNRLLLHRDTHRGGAHVCSRRLHAAAPHHVLAAHRPNRLLLHRDTHRGGAHVCSRRLHAAAPHHVLAAHRPNRLLLHRDTHRGGAHVCSRRLHAAAPHHVLAAHRPNRLLLHRDTHRGGAHVCSRRLHAAAPHHVLAAHRPNRLLLHRDTHRGGAHVCSRRLHAAAPHHVLAAHRPNRLLLHRDTHRVSVAGGGRRALLPVEGGAHVCSRRLHAAAPHHVLAAHRPNRLLLHRDTHRISTTAVSVSGLPGLEAGATPPKKSKYGGALATGAACAIVSCVDISWLGGVCVCVDTHAQLHVYRLPAADISTPLLVQHTTSLLEYAMVSGLDYRDIIMTLKPNAIDAVYERFTESFQRQPQAFQQFYYQNWLKLRIALCRVMPTAQGAVSSLTQLTTLAGAWAALAAALRGDDRRHDDVRLDALLEHEHDKALVTLEAKAELSSDAVALTPLRRILQQCVDIATTHLQHAATGHTHPDAVALTPRVATLIRKLPIFYALVTLEAKAELSSDAIALTLLRRILQQCVDIATTHLQHAATGHTHPYETWTDGTALALLRKLVVAARAAGRGGEPLSRALARLQHQNTKEAREECATLCLQLTTPRIWESLPRCTVSAPHGKPCPHYFEYGTEPEGLRYAPEPPNYGTMCEVMPSLGMDCIRYMYLGACAGSCRACTRCGARALAAARPAKHPMQRAYDGRFLAACRCGGKWTLVSNY
ncbi:mediator of RNA polymerase II transcription subunit 16 [Cydia strobilella]|uniref:mediator of RNA polymerase II transcription subunit 16 n=1 Tax=Cydia strobilella TaxID=1100964 RepID=UPI0030051F2E